MHEIEWSQLQISSGGGVGFEDTLVEGTQQTLQLYSESNPIGSC